MNEMPLQQRLATPPPFDPTKCKRLVCANCGGWRFTEHVAIHRMSRIASPDGQEWTYFNKSVLCDACGAVLTGPTADPNALVAED
jgi:hypothetical protein